MKLKTRKTLRGGERSVLCDGVRSTCIVLAAITRSTVATYDFLLMFHSNHGPISYRFQDKRRFQSKIANFSHLMYFTPPLMGFCLELVVGTRGQKN